MIKLTRVDHRLLHGQVAFAWIKYLDVDCILIVNDAVAKDKIRMSALRMARPDGVKLVIKGVDESIEALNSGITDKYNLLILTENIEDVCKLVSNVSAIKKINLGGARKAPMKKQIAKAFFISEHEIELIKQLISQKQAQFEVQMVPNDTAQDIVKLIGE
jgi:fructoselysine and glucoselysine-specific PTS system IIB component